MDQVKELKAQVFDVLAAQDQIRVQFERLEQQKQQLLAQIADLVKQDAGDK